jgi:hypothetical protein
LRRAFSHTSGNMRRGNSPKRAKTRARTRIGFKLGGSTSVVARKWWHRPDKSRYVVCSDVTLRPVFAFISTEIRPDYKLQCFSFGDDYSFGIYGFDPKQDLLAQLLAQNLSVAQREKDAQPVTAPGIPATYTTPDKIVTDDCIRP